MSNQTFLYTTPEPTKPLFQQCPEEGRLLMAAMSIPVFWYMLFDEDSLKLGPDIEDPEQQYLHLTTLTTEGLARAEGRWPAVSRVLGRQINVLFQTWVGFVREHASTYIHCETAEWFWMFDTHDKFEQDLRKCLSAFHNIPERIDNEVELNREWRHLLSQAHVSQYRGLQPLGNLSYCGFSYHFEVPWSEENDMVCGVLSEKFRDTPRYGQQPEDLLQFIEQVYGPVGMTRLLRCHCGGKTFQYTYSWEGAIGGKRTCTTCNASSFILESEHYWHQATPIEWTCPDCKGVETNIGLGLQLNDAETRVTFIWFGQRCTRCGRLDCSYGSDQSYGVTEKEWEGVSDWAFEQFCIGASLCDNGKYAEAVPKLRFIWEKFPEFRNKYDIRDYFINALSSTGAWQECFTVVEEALQNKPNERSYLFRMGQVHFELGRINEAIEWLVRAYHREHIWCFVGNDPKYLNLIRDKVELPTPDGPKRMLPKLLEQRPSDDKGISYSRWELGSGATATIFSEGSEIHTVYVGFKPMARNLLWEPKRVLPLLQGWTIRQLWAVDGWGLVFTGYPLVDVLQKIAQVVEDGQEYWGKG